MGVNPNSGRFAGMQNATGLQQAAMRANAMTGTRQQAEQMGYARQLDAAGLGRGLAGASLGAYGGASHRFYGRAKCSICRTELYEKHVNGRKYNS